MIPDEAGRFDRQLRVQGWQQDKLSGSRIMVLGAGSLGNEVVKNLALIGIGNIMIVDFDTVELSNLSRTVLFSEADHGQYKAETLAKACKRLYPAVNATYINGNVMMDVGLGFYRASDIVIGCLDNIATRSRASSNAALAGVPYLDTGVWAYGGELKWFFPEHSACFDCSLSIKDKTEIMTRYSCTGFKSEKNKPVNIMIPTTLAPSAIIGGMAVQEVCHYLNGTRTITPGEVIVYNGLVPSLHTSFLPENPDCEHHASNPYESVIKLNCSAEHATAREILEIAAKTLGENVTLELNHDFLDHLYCRHCDEQEMIRMPIMEVPEEKSYCPGCKKRRTKNVITSLTMQDAFCDARLEELGIAKGEILTLHSMLGMEFYQLNGDIEKNITNPYTYTSTN
jgi:molybdopterin/thiamine biosynthesis adenylyltransferase